MTYTELKAYATDKYNVAKRDFESWCNTYCIVDKALEWRMQAWYSAMKAKSKQSMIARAKLAACTTEELKLVNNL
jgi:hypothetical protein